MYKLNKVPIQISTGLYFESDKMTVKWKCNRCRITNVTFKKNKVEGLILPDFNTYYKTTVIKTKWY